MTATRKFQAHVHSETYTASDPLDYRTRQLHTKKADCTDSECLYADLIPSQKKAHEDAATALRKEIAAAKRTAAKEAQPLSVGAKKAIAKKAAAAAPSAKAETDWHAARAAAAAARAEKGETTKVRRNETRHPDGAAAVAEFACPQCGAKKGAQCFKANGTDRTPYVHAPRFAKIEAVIAAAYAANEKADGNAKPARRTRKATAK